MRHILSQFQLVYLSIFFSPFQKKNISSPFWQLFNSKFPNNMFKTTRFKSTIHLLKLPVKSKIEMNGVTDKRDHTQTDHELEKCEFTIPITNLSNK